MVDAAAIRRKRKTLLELFGEVALSDVDYLTSDELGNGKDEDEEDEENEPEGEENEHEGDEDEDDSEGETIGSEDWSLEESDDSQERREFEDFIVEDNWGKEESDIDYSESEEDESSDDYSVWGDAESWSGEENSDGFQAHEDSADEDGDY